MRVKRLSRRQKGYLLILGLLVLALIPLGGKLFRKEKPIKDRTPVANEELQDNA